LINTININKTSLFNSPRTRQHETPKLQHLPLRYCPSHFTHHRPSSFNPALRGLLSNSLIVRNIVEAGHAISTRNDALKAEKFIEDGQAIGARINALEAGESMSEAQHGLPVFDTKSCEHSTIFSNCYTLGQLGQGEIGLGGGGRVGAPVMGLLVVIAAAIALGV
jgi:hypothetical protein